MSAHFRQQKELFNKYNGNKWKVWSEEFRPDIHTSVSRVLAPTLQTSSLTDQLFDATDFLSEPILSNTQAGIGDTCLISIFANTSKYA